MKKLLIVFALVVGGTVPASAGEIPSTPEPTPPPFRYEEPFTVDGAMAERSADENGGTLTDLLRDFIVEFLI